MPEQFYANRYASILYRFGQRFLARALREEALPLEPAQLPVFLRAAHRPGIAQEDIAAATGLDKGTVARTAAALEAQGLLLRSPDPADRRVNRVSLSPRGQALLPRVEAVIGRLHDVIYKGLTREEQDAACRLLVQMCDNLRGSLAGPR